MRHFIPLATETGWAVAYENHRGEFVCVCECASLGAAYREAANRTMEAMQRATQLLAVNIQAASVVHGGNRYQRAAA